jgi:hypothetical protein
MPWERVMVLQIMRDLAPKEPRGARGARPWRGRTATITPLVQSAARPAPRTAQPNVFLTPWKLNDPQPPWAAVAVEGTQALDETLLRQHWQHRAPRRSFLMWVVFTMYFSIAFGVAHDPELRRETASQLRAATAEGAMMVQAEAIRLWPFASR